MASPMVDKDTSDLSTRGCIVIAGVIVVLLGVSFVGLAILGRNATERQRVARAADQFDKAKGRSSAHIFMEPQSINMLAEDQESIERLVELNLSSINFRDSDMTSVSKLANVKRVHVYSCSHLENFLRDLQGSQAIEELSFDTTVLTDEGIQLLATFPNLSKVHFEYVPDQRSADLLKSTLPDVKLEIAEIGQSPSQ